MTTPDADPELDSLFASLDRDAPAPDRAFLEALRERSTSSFQVEPPTSPRKRPMKLASFRWIAGIAATLVVGVVFAQWIVRMNRIPDAPPPDDEKFVASAKLTDDGRIGKVTDSQGIVSVKPVLAERWSPAAPQLVLKPGDLLRTDSRGANAVALKLLPSTGVIIGPHSTVELMKANTIRLLAGEVEIAAAADAPVELLGPDKQTLKIEGRQFIRIEKEKLVRVEKDPLWLQGFRGTTNQESLGSLVATVDGRNVPLTVGYHHVTVDIRDQIARTVIEESFVNRTDGVLEGVFYFPLPQDASISGFGMWIGDQLVEADVVEKQRAREIYETILRKRDPGLLEWAGGNIFKARVYPIPARSEKRIKISYTQVLPLKGNRYRYSYGLQSELLKQHPLRDLKIDVKVNSAVALKSITSPTHDTRLAMTEHSGHVEFVAQEYTPSRDFEAVIEVTSRASDVVVIPHQRGNDGYFLVQLTPPDGTGSWERPLIPNGEPLKLLLLADTSASMDRGQRAQQNALIASLLGALTPRDTINVAACDVNCDWIFDKPVPATPENIATIRDSLNKRVSLGWTNLDKAFTSALAMSDTGTNTIYLGDGISTNTDADPVAFAKRLAKLYEGKLGTFHAIALGSSFEPAAMKAIAALGGGSFRRVSGEQGPQTVVAELLTEIATPALRNLKVEILGVRTARVYPEELPNVAAGSQQILLGRYLPEGKDQQGEIVITGLLGSKPVRYVSKFSLKDAEQGNSFIPRLWARMHLDKLLEQGTSETIKQDIIALSEEFNIITPYTSLLVLETDADRERFKVQRRFQMRDGEKFFAAGRDNAMFELKQKQMRMAGDYRTALRRQVLAQLQTLGRNPRMFEGEVLQNMQQWGWNGNYYEGNKSFELQGRNGYLGTTVLTGGTLGGDDDFYDYTFATPGESKGLAPGFKYAEDRLGESLPSNMDPTGSEKDSPYYHPDKPSPLVESPKLHLKDATKALEDDDQKFDALFRDEKTQLNFSSAAEAEQVHLLSDGEFGKDKQQYNRKSYGYQATNLPWLTSYFPPLPPPAREWKEPKTKWPAEAVALSKSLLRSEKLTKQKGGLVIARSTETYGYEKALLTRNQRQEFVSPTAWLVRSLPENGPEMLQWCDAKELGAINTAYQLGRTRAANTFDLQRPPLELEDSSIAALHVTHAGSTATVEAIDKDRALLIVKYRGDPHHEVRYLVDTARHVLLSVERRRKGKTTATMKFSDFAEVAGMWWAKQTENLDDKGQRVSNTTRVIEELPVGDFAKRMATELESKAKTIILKYPLPKLADAKAAAAAKKATLEDCAVIVLHFAATQQWARSQEHLAEFENLVKDFAPRGRQFLMNSYLLASRKHEELRRKLLLEAKEISTVQEIPQANRYFLAVRLFELGQQVLQADEMLALSESLESIYLAQPAHLNAMKSWRNQRVYLLQNAGQAEKALAHSKSLAVDYPRDANLQYQYAQRLVGSGDYEAAYAWLDTALNGKWETSQAEMLRGQYAEFLRSQGRTKPLLDFLAKWIAGNPESDSPYAQYLSALVRNNEAKKAEELVAQWLREGRIAGELPKPTAARLTAAISFALGQAYYFYTNRIDERWLEPLAETALFFAHRDDDTQYANTILQQWRFANTDASKGVRKTLAQELLKGINTLPLARLTRTLDWVWNESGLDNAAWKKIAAELRKRWDAEKEDEMKDRIGQSLVRVLDRFDGEETLAFLRLQWKTADADYAPQYAHQLIDALLTRPWTAAIEDEAFALLDSLATPDELAGGLRTRVGALHRLTDTMVEARYQAEYKKLDRPDKLTRTELQKKQTELRKFAREGFADRLRTEVAKQKKPFANWVMIERLWLEVQLDRNLKQVADDCWTILETPAAKADPDDDNAKVIVAFDIDLRERTLITLSNLASRKGADAALIARLMKQFDDSTRKADKYRLLIALDRPQELEVDLHKWIALPESESRWRLALGQLLAEQGKVVEAIKQFEAVEAADELTPDSYRKLADWYIVENRREQSEKARRALYKTTDENALANRLYAYLRPWQSAHLPTQLDPEVFEIFQALFEKSTWPSNYLGTLQQFYQASRDFRLLSMLPDGAIGHTAGKVYPFLQGMRGVLGEVRDEATADELVARTIELRKIGKKTAVDLRALDLLELLVERRAAELHNQPGPHLDKALAALVRGFQRDWSPGEPRLMADFLQGLGNITPPALAKEQLRQLESLTRDAKPGTFDRLYIAQQYAVTLHGASLHEPAMEVLEAALNEYQTAQGGKLPTEANNAFGWLISFTDSAKQYDRGEKYLLAQLKHPIHPQQGYWLTNRLNELYLSALKNGGEVSLGKGETLYKALEKKFFTDLGTIDQNQRYALLIQLVRVYRAANDLKIASAVTDLKAFAFDRLPPLLKELANNYDDVIRQVSQAVRDLAGPRDGIAFLLDRIENEPDWMRYSNQNGWNQYSYTLNDWRTHAKDLGDLEPRLLKYVLAELRRDLRSGEPSNRTAYDRRNNFYWTAKEAEFAKVAEEVYAERKASGSAVEYIAEYLFFGLPQEKRAIEILFAAHDEKRLSESGQWKLVDYLHRTKRYAESIPLLVPILERTPGNMGYHTKLMHAYFRTGKQPELLALLKQTDAYFHEKDRWNQGAIAALGRSCLENKLFARSVAYYEELLPLYQRSHPRRPVGDGALHQYFTEASDAYAGLGKTKEAVDMASAAIVAWPARHDMRKQALDHLVSILVGAPKLEEYIAYLDAEKMQSAIVRKALGQALMKKNEHARAIPQFKLAAELQPNDAEITTALISCFDHIGDAEGAIRQLLEAVELSRRDIKLFEQLGSRMEAAQRKAEAERAFTSIVEMLPNESESHEMLAKIFEKQNRRPEAIIQWERIVQIRSLEPTGLLGLAAAQIDEKQWNNATETLRKLRNQSWPTRFSEVEKQTRELEQRLKERNPK